MHKDNRHAKGYNFQELAASFPSLSEFIIKSPTGDDSIDFGNYKAVKTLNQACLVVVPFICCEMVDVLVSNDLLECAADKFAS